MMHVHFYLDFNGMHIIFLLWKLACHRAEECRRTRENTDKKGSIWDRIDMLEGVGVSVGAQVNAQTQRMCAYMCV